MTNESECSEPRVRGLIGCHKLQVISRKRATNYRALLRPVRGLLPMCFSSVEYGLFVGESIYIHTYIQREYIRTCVCI